MLLVELLGWWRWHNSCFNNRLCPWHVFPNPAISPLRFNSSTIAERALNTIRQPAEIPQLHGSHLPVTRFPFEVHNCKNLAFIFRLIYPVNDSKRESVKNTPSIPLFYLMPRIWCLYYPRFCLL